MQTSAVTTTAPPGGWRSWWSGQKTTAVPAITSPPTTAPGVSAPTSSPPGQQQGPTTPTTTAQTLSPSLPSSTSPLLTPLPASSTCPYADIKRTSLVLATDPAYCRDICEVSNVCSTPRMYPASTRSFNGLSGIGNLTNYKNPELVVVNSYALDVRHMVLPTDLTSLSLENITTVDLTQLPTMWPASISNLRVANCNVGAFPPLFQWPANLYSANFDSNKLQTIPNNLPANLATLSMEHNYVTNVNNAPSSIQQLKLFDNKITSVDNQDWRSTQFISLGSNPLTSFTNVKLSTTLQYFDCLACPLSAFSIDKDTFAALNELNPSTDANPFVGFRISKNIDVNATDCVVNAGHVAPLWAGKTNLSVRVCVTNSQEFVAAGGGTTKTPTASHLSVGELVMAGSLCAIAVGLAVYLFVRYQEHKKKKLGYKQLTESISGHSVSTYDSFASREDSITSLHRLRLHKLEPSDLIVTAKAPYATGSFGEIWVGYYAGEKVAIKRMKDKNPGTIARFIEEVSVVATLEHEHIVRFIGANWARPIDLEYVMEFMDKGDLRANLATRSPAAFTWDDKCQILVSVIGALSYLHSFNDPKVHRDLKSKNILLDEKKGAKVTDFGEVPDPKVTGYYQWTAPEVLASNDYSPASDIYSFGVILSELSTHAIPYADMKRTPDGKPQSSQMIVDKIVAGTLRPSFNKDTSPAWLLEMADKCLTPAPQDRPTALQLQVSIRRHSTMESKSRQSKKE
ncbi:Aste57867_985 [Aphanomyces stellatus]|uniref:Aste57867_985 protein n=1 Tax=Aphanomyces stellatus TaxID=120398 RepID=A0A485K5A1_9STRA|nr:hypothetical protein As57867_000984 [Aphanomyces stellatus]VFT78207.1 Aste57867_985 [Aphanomyces stellatus]